MAETLEKKQAVEIEVFASIAKLISSGSDGQIDFDKVFDLLLKLVPFDAATLFMYSEEDEILKEVSSLNGGVDLVENFSFGEGLGTGLSAYVAEQKRPILLPDLHKGPRFDDESLKSFLSVPLLVEQTLVGVLNLGHYQSGKFEKQHIEYLEIVAVELALIIVQLKYRVELEKKNKELERMNKLINETKDKLIEAERMATLGHITAGINHEINNPLAVISGHMQLLEMEDDTISENVMERVRIVIKEVDRISDVLRKLQKVKKIALSNYSDSGIDMLDIEKSISNEG